MDRILTFFAASAFALLSVSCSGGCIGKGNVDGNKVIPVKVMTASPRQTGSEDVYVGTVRAGKSTVVTAKYSGTLVSLKAFEGQRVKKGDTLAVIESRSVISMKEAADATLAYARDGYERVRSVHESGGIADVKMIELQTELAKAEASARAAQQAYDDCTVRAPYSGVVGEVFTDEGVSLSVSAPLFRILDVSEVEITIPVPENEINGVRVGEKMDVNVPALDGAGFKVSVKSKGLSASPLSHSYQCVLTPEGKVGGLMPGMVCKVSRPSFGEAAIVIPTSIVRTDMDGHYVWIVEGDRVAKRHITTGGYSGAGVIVPEGLSEGDKVIIEGMQKVSIGMKVKVTED